MLPFSRPSVYNLTCSTPSPLTYEQDISPKHTLNVHDLDGKGNEWIVQASISKLSIYNSQNLTLRLRGRIITSTIDIWECKNLSIFIDGSTRLETLQLDPSLENVKIIYSSPETIGKIVMSPGSRSFGFKDLSFTAGLESKETFVMADKDGNLYDPYDQYEFGGQLVLSYENGEWKLQGLKRGAMNYPIL